MAEVPFPVQKKSTAHHKIVNTMEEKERMKSVQARGLETKKRGTLSRRKTSETKGDRSKPDRSRINSTIPIQKRHLTAPDQLDPEQYSQLRWESQQQKVRAQSEKNEGEVR